jgi:DNA repair protein RecN (Recombination protein N)
LRLRVEERHRHLELWQYQLRELNELDPRPQEDQQLSDELKVLANAEELKKSGFQLAELLFEAEDSVHDRLSAALQAVVGLAELDSTLDEPRQMLQEAVLQIQESAACLSTRAEQIENSPERLEIVQQRLSQLDTMIRKYGGNIESLFAHREQISQELNASDTLDAELAAAADELEIAGNRLEEQARALTVARQEGARRLTASIAPILEELGIRGGHLEVRMNSTGDLTHPSGNEQPVFLISTNPDTPLGPLELIASGGELSRIMLAVKLILLESEPARCIIFDEIDSGLSGRAALAVSEVLKKLAQSNQLLCITHLPQIAAAAANQMEVEKTWSAAGTSIKVYRLERENRLRVIARLQAGIENREELDSAERLLNRSGY